jgi:hypothetical protein
MYFLVLRCSRLEFNELRLPGVSGTHPKAEVNMSFDAICSYIFQLPSAIIPIFRSCKLFRSKREVKNLILDSEVSCDIFFFGGERGGGACLLFFFYVFVCVSNVQFVTVVLEIWYRDTIDIFDVQRSQCFLASEIFKLKARRIDTLERVIYAIVL